MLTSNRLVEDAALSKLRLAAPLSALLFIAMLIFSQFAMLPFTVSLDLLTSGTQNPYALVMIETFSRLVIPFLTSIAVVFLWVKFVEKRPIVTLGFYRNQWESVYLKGFFIGSAMMIAYFIFALMLGVYSPNQIVFSATSPLAWFGVLFPLVGWLIQGASEEILTRGWLFQACSKKHILTGIVISSSIFTMLHLGNAGITALSIINLTLYGLFAVLLALKTQSLWAVCGYHSAWNWVQGNLLGIAVSGNSTLGSSLLTPGPVQKSALLNGGTFGAEGSVIVSGILILSCVYLMIQLKKTAPTE